MMDVYEAIMTRRDVRSWFDSRPIPDAVLARILNAAHHAPSVGYSQPWNFIIIKDATIRGKIKALFEEERVRFGVGLEDKKKPIYDVLKLEGIMESPINIAVTCDSSRFGPNVLGRSTMPETSAYSSVLAAGNIWLAARAEGIGTGWVSIFNKQKVKEVLEIPDSVELVAYLCLGYVEKFPDLPELEEKGWNRRTKLADLVFGDTWGHDVSDGLRSKIEENV